MHLLDTIASMSSGPLGWGVGGGTLVASETP